MSKVNVIRAWKDRNYRNSLTAEQKAALPENPAGAVEVPADVAQNVNGGTRLQIASNGGGGGVFFITASWLCNCKNISAAMSVTSSCCCYAQG